MDAWFHAYRYKIHLGALSHCKLYDIVGSNRYFSSQVRSQELLYLVGAWLKWKKIRKSYYLLFPFQHVEDIGILSHQRNSVFKRCDSIFSISTTEKLSRYLHDFG